MENTTATLHDESAQQDARQLVDGNRWEDVIAHELFHHVVRRLCYMRKLE